MTVTYVGSAPAGSPNWKAMRANGLGGSEVAAALGLSPWCSPFTLWHRKRGELEDVTETPSMYWGKILEDTIIDEWLRRHGARPPWPGKRRGTWERDGWRIASPDWIDHDETLLEAKTADAHDAWEWGEDGSDDPEAVPPYYRVQTLWYGDVTGVYDLHLAVLLGGNDFRQYRVPWDEQEVVDIRTRAWAFWQTVTSNVRPPLDGSDSTYQTVRQLHPQIVDEEVEIPADSLVAWEVARVEAKHALEDAAAARSRIADVMGQAKYGTVAGRKVVRRQAVKGGRPFVTLVRNQEG